MMVRMAGRWRLATMLATIAVFGQAQQRTVSLGGGQRGVVLSAPRRPALEDAPQLQAAPWVHLCVHKTRCTHTEVKECGRRDDVDVTPVEALKALQASPTYDEASMWRWMDDRTASLRAALPLPSDESAPIVEWLRGRRLTEDAHLLHMLRVLRCMFDEFRKKRRGCGAADAEAILGYELSKYAIGKLWAAAHPRLSTERLDERNDSLALEGIREGRQFALLGSWLLARAENASKTPAWTRETDRSPEGQVGRGDDFRPAPPWRPRSGSGVLFSAFDAPPVRGGGFGDRFLRVALCQANATVARLRAAGDETWEVAVAMTVQATAQADALCDQFECAGIRRVRIPMVMRASRYHPYGRHPRVFKIRTMRFSPFRFTLFLDNDANVATPRSFGVLTSAFREMRAVNATIATFREGHPAGSRYVAEDEVPGGCPPGRLSAVGDEHRWTIPIAREQNSGTILMDSDAEDVRHFLLRWEHYVGTMQTLNPAPSKDQVAFVFAFSETIPRWVDLKRLGFLDPRDCCIRCTAAHRCDAACVACHQSPGDPEARWGPVDACPNLTLAEE